MTHEPEDLPDTQQIVSLPTDRIITFSLLICSVCVKKNVNSLLSLRVII